MIGHTGTRSSDNYREALNIRTAEWNKMHSKLNACISELDSVKAQLVVAESQATELQGTIDTWSINAFEDAKTISKHLERIQTLERQVKAEQGARKSAREDYFTCRVDLENLGAEIDRLQVEIQQMKNEQADSAE